MWIERPTRPPCEILRAPFDLTHGKQGIGGGGGVYIRGFITRANNHPTTRQNNFFFA